MERPIGLSSTGLPQGPQRSRPKVLALIPSARWQQPSLPLSAHSRPEIFASVCGSLEFPSNGLLIRMCSRLLDSKVLPGLALGALSLGKHHYEWVRPVLPATHYIIASLQRGK
ncbi:uncharacterized protein BO66DRAFT_96095 [Aspergillus aculeatinus CBS 121060]|uniref:Uncharacterized protein n=1 Tax=Aspergillus aculeatinus CBS 121060 TaxID=1448322 RepID=A0ACD1H856_9EURO|nr:hypothetical protein BO66DRAFT_96095 [Aspergillus aculeatinus CBS 121060]RAH69766.1 hypothetical protein BO66DRAFT_96095 [Aspergillus aculeatinus CBS 121060]